MFDLVY